LRLLLDTHIWIWFLQSPEHLASRVRKELVDPANERWLSPVSTWEVLTLHHKRRVVLGPDFLVWLGKSAPGFHQAVLTHEIVLAAEKLSLHADPADRFLAATAQVLDLILVTADQRLLGLGTIRTLANR
jgi:PIN domain nuclease of toxin-antitoxin system